MVKKSKYKRCTKCHLKKSILEFPIDKRSIDKRRASCKKCKNAISKQSYEDTRDEPTSVSRRILKKCKEREKFRLAKFIKHRDDLEYLPDVQLTEDQFNLDVEWMLKQRDSQNNKCYYTDLDMIWSTGLIDENKRINPRAVTIERIDSLGNYVKSNCVLSCWWANCAKNSGPINELVEFSLEVVKKYVNNNIGESHKKGKSSKRIK